MSDESVQKIGVVVPVSNELLASWNEMVTSWWSDETMVRRAFGLGPDNRTDEQKARDRAAWAAETGVIREQVQVEHARILADADGLRRAVLELHGPSFYSDTDRTPRCEGCDMEGYEAEAPAFPCRTYELAADFRSRCGEKP